MDTSQEHAPLGAKKGRPSQAPSAEHIRVAIVMLRHGNRGRIPMEWARSGYKARKRTMQNYVAAIVRAMNYNNSQTQLGATASGAAGSPTGTSEDPAALNEVYLLTLSILENNTRGASIAVPPQGRSQTGAHSNAGGLLSAQLAPQQGQTSPVPSIHLNGPHNSTENMTMPMHTYAYSAPNQHVYPNHQYGTGQEGYLSPGMTVQQYPYMGGAATYNAAPYGIESGQSFQGYYPMEAHDQYNLAAGDYNYNPMYLNTSMPQSYGAGPSSYNDFSTTVQSNYHSLHASGSRPPLSRIRTDLLQPQARDSAYESSYALRPEPESDEAAQRSATEVFRLELDQMAEANPNAAQQLPPQRIRPRGNTLTMNGTAARHHRRIASDPFTISSPMLRQLAHQNGSPVQRRPPSRATHPYRRHGRNPSSLTGGTNFDDPAAQPMFQQNSGSFNGSLFVPGSAPFTPVTPVSVDTSFGSYPSSQQRPTPASSGLPSSFEMVGSQGSNNIRRIDTQVPASSSPSTSGQHGPQSTVSASHSATTYPISIPETIRQSQSNVAQSAQYSGSAGARQGQPEQNTGLTPALDAIDFDDPLLYNLEDGGMLDDLLSGDDVAPMVWPNTYGSWGSN